MTTYEFVVKAIAKHGTVYDYSSVDYCNAVTKVTINCRDHGPFQQLPRKHLVGSRCPRCARSSANDYRKVDVNTFKQRAVERHGDVYDYSQVVLINLNSIVEISCPHHGKFRQRAMSHLYGHGCKKCQVGHKASITKFVYDTEWFVEKATSVHGQTYDYSCTSYKSSLSSVAIKCRLHGEFRQVARDHLNGYGCGACGLEALSRTNARSKEEFVKVAVTKHHSKYDYSLVDYRNQDLPVLIVCAEHGSFLQKPRHHLRGQGCPTCKLSSGHNSLLSFLKSLQLDPKVNDRNILSPYELDIWLPSHEFAIEYHGLYWHSFGQLETTSQIRRHAVKQDLASRNNITLFQVFEHEWLKKRVIIESMIKCRLGLCVRIPARKAAMERVSDKAASDFYKTNHLMGHRASKFHYALIYDSELVACMSFSAHPKYQYELTRYSTAIGLTVVGGPSKLFSAFNRDCCPDSVFSFADNRYASGKMYERLGFKPLGITKPNYYYVDGLEVYSRQKFQKHKLANLLVRFDGGLSETVNMFNNGYRRIWDAGHRRFLWSRK